MDGPFESKETAVRYMEHATVPSSRSIGVSPNILSVVPDLRPAKSKMGTDIIYKTFEDQDIVFSGGKLLGRVVLRWTSAGDMLEMHCNLNICGSNGKASVDTETLFSG